MANQRLQFVLDDVVNGEPVTPSSMPVGLMSQFNDQVARFLKGAHADVDLDSLRVSIEKGSYKLVLPVMALVTGLTSDLALLASANLDDMDAKRAEVVEEWQKAARRTQTRKYDLLPETGQAIHIHAGTRLERHDNAMWVAVEKYINGHVMDMGGVKPNLHLKLPSGITLKVNTSQDQVLSEDKNLVYRPVMLRIRAEEDIATGTLRNVRLLEFVDYAPTFDVQAFEMMVKKGRKAWADVPDATEWVEKQRGGE